MSMVREKPQWIADLSAELYSNKTKYTLSEFQKFYALNFTSWSVQPFVEQITFQNAQIESEFCNVVFKYCSSRTELWNFMRYFKPKNQYRTFEKCADFFIQTISRNVRPALIPSLIERFECIFCETIRNKPTDKLLLRRVLITGYGALFEAATSTHVIISIVQSISSTNFKLFYLTFKQSEEIINEFMNLVCDVMERTCVFIKSTNDLNTFFTMTKLIVEFFAEKCDYVNSAKFGIRILNLLRALEIPAVAALKSFLEYLINGDSNDMDEVFAIMATCTEEINYDLSLTIANIVGRIEDNLVKTINGEIFHNFRKLFDVLCKSLKRSYSDKTFCTHCSNSKRHGLVKYIGFLMMASRELNNNKMSLNVDQLTGNSKLLQYAFKLFEGFECSTAQVLMANIAINAYNLIIRFAQNEDSKVAECAIYLAKILLENIAKYKIEMTVAPVEILRLMGECFLHLSLTKYLEINVFVLSIYSMTGKDMTSVLRNILQNVYSDDVKNSENYMNIEEVISRLPKTMYGVLRGECNVVDIIGDMLLEVGNYKARQNIRKKLIVALFSFSKTDPAAVAKYYIAFNIFESSYLQLVKDLKREYEKCRNYDLLLLGILKCCICQMEIDVEKIKLKEKESKLSDKKSKENPIHMTLELESVLLANFDMGLKMIHDAVMEKDRQIASKIHEPLCNILDMIGHIYYSRNYLLKAARTFKILYIIASKTSNNRGILKAFIFFACHRQYYKTLHRECSTEIPEMSELLNQYKNITIERNSTIPAKTLLSAQLSYVKYQLSTKKCEVAVKTLTEIKGRFPTLLQDSGHGTTLYTLKFYQILIMCHILNRNASLHKTNRLIQKFVVSINNCTYNSYTSEYDQLLVTIFETIELLGEPKMKKLSSFIRPLYNIVINFASNCAPQRIVVAIKSSFGYYMSMGKIEEAIAFHARLQNILNIHKDDERGKILASVSSPVHDSMVDGAQKITNICKLNTKMSWQQLVDNSGFICVNVRRHNNSIAVLSESPPFTLSCASKDNLSDKCTCYICDPDRDIRFHILEFKCVIATFDAKILDDKAVQELVKEIANWRNNRLEHKTNFDLAMRTGSKLHESLADIACIKKDYATQKMHLIKALKYIQAMRDNTSWRYIYKIIGILRSMEWIKNLKQVLSRRAVSSTPAVAVRKERHYKTLNTHKFTINVDESSPLRALSPNENKIPASPNLLERKNLRRTPRAVGAKQKSSAKLTTPAPKSPARKLRFTSKINSKKPSKIADRIE